MSLPEELAAVAQELCGGPIVSAQACGGGGNNRVYRVQTQSNVYALKFYGSAGLDGSDRLKREYGGISFLKNSGGDILLPSALAVDWEARCALYEWIEGGAPTTHDVTDVRAVLDLLAMLHARRRALGASGLPPAKEAVLRLSDLSEQIVQRLGRLTAASASEPDLAAFLRTGLQPEIDRFCAALSRLDTETLLPRAEQTLSPSDFGFHNALRTEDGTLVFIDFEYFGWDDPVKLGADFLWHPAMILSEQERSVFLEGIFALYGSEPHFERRFAACYPLYGIRWMLIILNEFLPDFWARRTFSGKGHDWKEAKRAQLQKARAALTTLRSVTEGHLRL